MLGVILFTSVMFVTDVKVNALSKCLDKVSGTYYELDSKGNAIVTWYYYNYQQTKYWKIPSKIKGHTVTKIKFPKLAYQLPEKVKIPKTVKSVNKYFTKSVFNVQDFDRYTGTLVVNKNSYAHKYAIKNEIKYYLIEEKRYYSRLFDDVNIYDTKGKKLKNYDLPNYTHTGVEVKPKFTLKRKDTGKVLKKNVDYTVKYNNNILTGEGVAIVKGKGNYFRSASFLFFKIIPAKPYAFDFGNFSERLLITAYTDASYVEYEVIYSTDKDFTNYKKVICKPDIYLYNLNKNKTYYFKVRAIVNCCGFMRETNQKLHPDYSINYTLKGRWSDVVSYSFKK